MNKPELHFKVPVFREYEMPEGFLSDHIACHALWYYYLCARNAFETNIQDPVVYEDQEDPTTNFKQLMQSIALAYGTQPEEMIKYWRNIDMQCDLMHLPRMPEGDEYRFNVTPEIRTQ